MDCWFKQSRSILASSGCAVRLTQSTSPTVAHLHITPHGTLRNITVPRASPVSQPVNTQALNELVRRSQIAQPPPAVPHLYQPLSQPLLTQAVNELIHSSQAAQPEAVHLLKVGAVVLLRQGQAADPGGLVAHITLVQVVGGSEGGEGGVREQLPVARCCRREGRGDGVRRGKGARGSQREED